MRRLITVFVLLLTACATGQEVAPTPVPDTTPPGPTTSVAEVTTTTGEVTTTGEPQTTTTLSELEGLAYQEVARIDFPIQVIPRNDSTSLLATKDGQIYTFDGSAIGESPILDISARVRNDGEQGLLSIAIHPEDDTRLFIHFSAEDGDTMVEEFRIEDDGVVPDPVASLLRLDQPASNHNGGMLQFGPDGGLYLGLGDGGRSNDAFGHGQNTETLFAGLVRFDVDGGDPTLFQYGLRNPWRFWIDGDLVYIADVGQNSFEEVNVAPLEEGLNYGWSITEGLHCFNPSSDCDTNGLTLPVIEVEHGDDGTCSITGGIVYQGAAIPEIQGHYFYSDWCGGYLRSFRYVDGSISDGTDWTDQVGTPGNVVSFGVDHTGEMYVLTGDAVLKVVAERAG